MKYILFLLVILLSLTAIAQQPANNRSTIYFIHSNRFPRGISTPFVVYIDEQKVCKLNNRHYSIHQIEPGNHKFSTDYLIGHDKKAQAISFTTEPEKTYYVQIIYQEGFLSAKLSCTEITENSAKLLLPKLEEDTKCL